MNTHNICYFVYERRYGHFCVKVTRKNDQGAVFFVFFLEESIKLDVSALMCTAENFTYR